MHEHDPDFDAAVAVTPRGEGRYGVRLAEAWSGWRGGPNGGYLAGLIARAMEAEIADPARQLRVINAHYVSALTVGEAEVVVRVERAGGTLTNLSARVEQEGRTRAVAIAAFATGYPPAIVYSTGMPVDVPPPDAVGPTQHPPEATPTFAWNFDMRHVVGGPPFPPEQPRQTGGWIALRQERAVDAPLLVTLCDVWWPPIPYIVVDGPVLAPTLELTVHVRAPLPLAHGHLFALCTSFGAADGYVDYECQLHAADGTLVAQSRQLALLSRRT